MNEKFDFFKGKNCVEMVFVYFFVWNFESYYGESYIVQNISFNVYEGEILVLFGWNGVGKIFILCLIVWMDELQV